MKNLGWLAAGLIMSAGCQSGGNSRTALPPTDVIIAKKAQAPLHPTDHYFLGQVEVRLSNADELDSFVERMEAKHGISLQLLDRNQFRPIYLFEVNGDQSLDSVVSAMKEERSVVGASKNYLIKQSQITSERAPFKTLDPLLNSQWGLGNTAQEAPRSLAGRKDADISMGGVETEGSKDVVVGIIDTGIDYLHEDLAVTQVVDGHTIVLQESNIWINPGEIPGNNINDDNNGDTRSGMSFVDDVYGYNFVSRNGDPMDDMGHGTHVAGVIGALRNNHKGIAGMNAKVSMMGLKFLDDFGSGSDFDAQMALYYFMDIKKRYPDKKYITSNSWGAAGRSSINGDEDDLLLMAFADADNEGILNIAAAGNDGMSNRFFESYPANYSDRLTNFLTVAASNNMDQLAYFSNYGFGKVQVAAPGVMIMSTVPAKLYPTPYEAWSGTSMATPHVTGLAALVWAANPNFTAADVKQRILDTVDILPQFAGAITTSGRINVKRALEGDVNIALAVVPQEEVISWVVESPRGDDRKGFDWITPITVEGAKQISVCFSRIDLVADNDWIEVLDSNYRVKDLITGTYRNRNFKNQSREICTAPVPGDTVNLRLWNAGVFSVLGGFIYLDASAPGLQGFETSHLKVVR